MKWGKKSSSGPIPPELLPQHVGIIMDGNGRWAKKRGLPRKAGHVVGAKVCRTVVKHCQKLGIKVVTVYAFSTENWKRPKEEIDALMNLLRDYLRDSMEEFRQDDVRTCFIGDRSPLPPDILALIEEMETSTAHKTGMTFNIALNYGGRDEIVHGVREIAREIKDGTLSPDDVDEATVTAHLYTAGQPDPDMILRPSGEYRLSNFLIWQSAYAEYVFMDVLWPDFSPKDMDAALREYARRNRRFGGV